MLTKKPIFTETEEKARKIFLLKKHLQTYQKNLAEHQLIIKIYKERIAEIESELKGLENG